MYRRMANQSVVLRSRAEIARFFDGFELPEPGLVPVSRWRPDAEASGKASVAGSVSERGAELGSSRMALDDTELPGTGDVWVAAGVGRKPGRR